MQRIHKPVCPGTCVSCPVPESWHLDRERMAPDPATCDAQFALFTDYTNHFARFDELATYHRAHQPLALVLERT